MRSPCPHTAINWAGHNKAIMCGKCLENVYTFLFNAIRENINGLMFKVTLHYFVSGTLRVHMTLTLFMRLETPAPQGAGCAAQDKTPGSLVHKKILEIPCST